MNLDDSAHVDAYRNGGEGLEGHDQDKVAQPPKASDLASDLLAQTGDGTGIAVAIAGTMAAVASGAALMRKRAA